MWNLPRDKWVRCPVLSRTWDVVTKWRVQRGQFREVKWLAQDFYARVGLDFNPFVLDSQTQAFNYLLIHFVSRCIFPVTPMAAVKNPSSVSRQCCCPGIDYNVICFAAVGSSPVLVEMLLDTWLYIKMPVWKGSQTLCKVQRYPTELRRTISALQNVL